VCLQGDHLFYSAKHGENGFQISQGTVFLVDADDVHWLKQNSEESPIFVCLQWELHKDSKLQENIASILKSIDANLQTN